MGAVGRGEGGGRGAKGSQALDDHCLIGGGSLSLARALSLSLSQGLAVR